MTGLDAHTLLALTATLVRGFLALYEQQAGQPLAGTPLEQQLGRVLAPGLVAFAGRLSAALPPEYDLRPVLARFVADPAVVEALNRLGVDEHAATRTLADAFLATGIDTTTLDRIDFDDALAEWAAMNGEAIRVEMAAHAHIHQTAQIFREQATAPTPRRQAMAELLAALAAHGLGYIAAGQIVAADGSTVLHVWPSGVGYAGEMLAESAGPDERETSGGLESLAEEPAAEAVVEPPPPPPPPPSPAVPPTSPGPAIVTLRLDAAAPASVVAGRPFDLAVALRRPDSPPLAPDDLAQRESAGVGVLWVEGAAFVSLRIQVSAPDCDIAGGDTRPVRLLAGQDGPTVYFQLTPRRAGPLSIIITVYQEMDWIGSARVLTEAGADAAAEPRGALAITVASQPLGDAEVNLKTLRDALDNGYNDAELRDLCFELEVDYDDLPGDGQSAKARELVLLAKRRGLIASLVALVLRDRPHLLG